MVFTSDAQNTMDLRQIMVRLKMGRQPQFTAHWSISAIIPRSVAHRLTAYKIILACEGTGQGGLLSYR